MHQACCMYTIPIKPLPLGRFYALNKTLACISVTMDQGD